jgi:hypothetical protein
MRDSISKLYDGVQSLKSQQKANEKSTEALFEEQRNAVSYHRIMNYAVIATLIYCKENNKYYDEYMENISLCISSYFLDAIPGLNEMNYVEGRCGDETLVSDRWLISQTSADIFKSVIPTWCGEKLEVNDDLVVGKLCEILGTSLVYYRWQTFKMRDSLVDMRVFASKEIIDKNAAIMMFVDGNIYYVYTVNLSSIIHTDYIRNNYIWKLKDS